MSEEELEVKPAPKAKMEAPPEEEKPIFDLGQLLQARRQRGEAVGFWETLAYLDYQDRKEEREWRRQERESLKQSQQSSSPNPEVEALKDQVAKLTETVNDLLETIRSQRQEEAQKQFVEGVVKQTTEKIMPELQAVKQKLDEYDEMLAKGERPEFSLEDLKETLTDAIDKIGEKAGASGKTVGDVVNDVDKLLGIIDSLEKRIRKGEGEVDYKTMAVSTVGEIGKELIGAYRDIATTSSSPSGFEAPKTETPASTMRTVIKRQVQNYITQRMTAGATTMNIEEAAKTLGLTPGQVMWAYETLTKEGWFHVKLPQKERKKVPESEIVSPPAEKETEIQTEQIETEGGEQVFAPPSA